MKTLLLLAIAAILMGVVFSLECYNNIHRIDEITGTHYLLEQPKRHKCHLGYNLCIKGHCDNREYFGCSTEDDFCEFLGTGCNFCSRFVCYTNLCNIPGGASPICLLNIENKLIGLLAIGFLAIGTLMIAEGLLI